jgi:hypothetical protein
MHSLQEAAAAAAVKEPEYSSMPHIDECNLCQKCYVDEPTPGPPSEGSGVGSIPPPVESSDIQDSAIVVKKVCMCMPDAV